MKNIFALTFACVCCFTVVKAQTIPSLPGKTDTLKTLEDFARFIKEHPVISPKTGTILNRPSLLDSLLKGQGPLMRAKIPGLKLTEIVAENMPVAKLTSADRMPIVKLGDTKTTHFTMLLKPLGSPRNDKQITTP